MSAADRKVSLRFVDADGKEMSHSVPLADEDARDMFARWQRGEDSFYDDKGRPVSLRLEVIQ